MFKTIIYPLLVSSVMLVPSAANAGLYVSGNIGIATPSDAVTDVFDDDGRSKRRTVETPLDSGIALFGAVGYDFGKYRIEGELGYQKTSSSDLSLQKYSGGSGAEDVEYYLTGDGSVMSLCANAYYDFNVKRIKPYLMGGLGVARLSIENIGGSLSAFRDDVFSAQSVTALVYQIGCGVEIPLSDTVSFDASFRHFATKNFNVLFSSENYSEDSINAKEIQFSSNSILFGLKIKI